MQKGFQLTRLSAEQALHSVIWTFWNYRSHGLNFHNMVRKPRRHMPVFDKITE